MNRNRSKVMAWSAVRYVAVAAPASMLAAMPAFAQVPAAAPTAAPAGQRADLNARLVNLPAADWVVFGRQTSERLATGGPQNYPAMRVTAAKGANAWDAGATAALVKPVAAGDTVLVAAYLRAPLLKDGETTPVPYVGLNQSAAPYAMIASAAVVVTNQWKLYFASAKAPRAFQPSELVVGIHLAGAAHVVELGPVRVFDLGAGYDPARLPKN